MTTPDPNDHESGPNTSKFVAYTGGMVPIVTEMDIHIDWDELHAEFEEVVELFPEYESIVYWARYGQRLAKLCEKLARFLDNERLMAITSGEDGDPSA